MSIFFYISLVIFVSTLILVILKPRNIGIGYSALAGALVSLLLGITTLDDVLIVWHIVWNATFTLISIIILSMVFDDAGFFEYIAIKLAKRSNGSGMRLFVIIILLGAAISAVFANDGTALILTPIVFSLLLRSGLSRKEIIPFIMATGFIADSSSLPFVVSNLVNIVTTSYFSITFLEYAARMLFPDFIAIMASLAFLWLYYRREIPSRIDITNLPSADSVIKDRLIFRMAPWIIALLIFSYSAGSIYNVPVAFISVPVAAVVMIIARRNRIIDTTDIVKKAPWQIVLFSLGMYIVVFGLGREGLTGILASLLILSQAAPGFLSTVIPGFIFAYIAAVMNNMPSVMLGNLAISHVSSPGVLAYANVIGNDIGPKFTPIGSLATLLWLHTLERKHSLRISGKYYMKVGLLVATPVLFITLLSLLIP